MKHNREHFDWMPDADGVALTWTRDRVTWHLYTQDTSTEPLTTFAWGRTLEDVGEVYDHEETFEGDVTQSDVTMSDRQLRLLGMPNRLVFQQMVKRLRMLVRNGSPRRNPMVGEQTLDEHVTTERDIKTTVVKQLAWFDASSWTANRYGIKINNTAWTMDRNYASPMNGGSYYVFGSAIGDVSKAGKVVAYSDMNSFTPGHARLYESDGVRAVAQLDADQLRALGMRNYQYLAPMWARVLELNKRKR